MTNEDRKILITGANGFLGSNLVPFLKNKYKNVICVFGPPDDNAVDLKNLENVTSLFSEVKPDVIVHLGGLVNLSSDYNIKLECIQTNLIGTLNVLEAMVKNNVKSILYTSSYDVYGPNTVPYNEKQRPIPQTVYSLSKIACEELIMQYNRLHGVNYEILRPTNVIGPHQNENRLIPYLIKSLKNGDSVKISSGKIRKDYLDISDLVRAIDKFIEIEAKSGFDNHIYNIGTGKSISIEEIINILLRITNSKSQIEYNPSAVRVGEMEDMYVSTEELNKKLNWKPEKDIEAALLELLSCY